MRLTRRLYQRFRVLIHEAAKFGVVGLAGFIVSLGGADVLHYGAGRGQVQGRRRRDDPRDRGHVRRQPLLGVPAPRADRDGPGNRPVLRVQRDRAAHPAGVRRDRPGRPAPERQGLVQRRQPGRHRAGHAVPLLVLPQVGVADAGARQRGARQRAPSGLAGARVPGGRGGGGGRRRPGRRGHAVRPRGRELRRRRGLRRGGYGAGSYGGGAGNYGQPEGNGPGTGNHRRGREGNGNGTRPSGPRHAAKQRSLPAADALGGADWPCPTLAWRGRAGRFAAGGLGRAGRGWGFRCGEFWVSARCSWCRCRRPAEAAGRRRPWTAPE